MTENEQAEFLKRVENALNRKNSGRGTLADIIQTEPAAADRSILDTINQRGTAARLGLLTKMMEIGPSLNVSVMAEDKPAAIASAVLRIAIEKESEWGEKKTVIAWDHPLVNSLKLSTAQESLDIPVFSPDPKSDKSEQEIFRRQAENALIGVTSADYCLSHTATLVMKTRPGQPQCVSLLPSIHVAVIRLEQIIADLKELYALLKWDPAQRTEGLTDTMTFVTGPSKTADIEATLVHGAHGPKELYIFVLK